MMTELRGSLLVFISLTITEGNINKLLNTSNETKNIIWASWYTQSKKSDENRKRIRNKENR